MKTNINDQSLKGFPYLVGLSELFVLSLLSSLTSQKSKNKLRIFGTAVLVFLVACGAPIEATTTPLRTEEPTFVVPSPTPIPTKDPWQVIEAQDQKAIENFCALTQISCNDMVGSKAYTLGKSGFVTYKLKDHTVHNHVRLSTGWMEIYPSNEVGVYNIELGIDSSGATQVAEMGVISISNYEKVLQLEYVNEDGTIRGSFWNPEDNINDPIDPDFQFKLIGNNVPNFWGFKGVSFKSIEDIKFATPSVVEKRKMVFDETTILSETPFEVELANGGKVKGAYVVLNTPDDQDDELLIEKAALSDQAVRLLMLSIIANYLHIPGASELDQNALNETAKRLKAVQDGKISIEQVTADARVFDNSNPGAGYQQMRLAFFTGMSDAGEDIVLINNVKIAALSGTDIVLDPYFNASPREFWPAFIKTGNTGSGYGAVLDGETLWLLVGSTTLSMVPGNAHLIIASDTMTLLKWIELHTRRLDFDADKSMGEKAVEWGRTLRNAGFRIHLRQ